jgi:hypothetical protein
LLCIPQGIPIHLLFAWTVVGHYFLCLTIVSDRMKDGRGGVAIFHGCTMACFSYV